MRAGNPNILDSSVAEPFDDQRHAEFVALIGSNYRMIYAVVLTILGKREDAQDAMQEVALILWRKFSEYDRDQNFSRWAAGIAKNVARDLARRRSSKQGIGLNDDVLSQLVYVQSGIGELLELRREQLKKCMAHLKDDDRRLIIDCYSCGNTIRSIAQARQLQPTTLYSKIAKIRRRLHDCIERQLKQLARESK